MCKSPDLSFHHRIFLIVPKLPKLPKPQLMMNCWHPGPMARPSVAAVRDRLICIVNNAKESSRLYSDPTEWQALQRSYAASPSSTDSVSRRRLPAHLTRIIMSTIL